MTFQRAVNFSDEADRLISQIEFQVNLPKRRRLCFSLGRRDIKKYEKQVLSRVDFLSLIAVAAKSSRAACGGRAGI
jgi:hypothetical protein